MERRRERKERKRAVDLRLGLDSVFSEWKKKFCTFF